MRNLVLILIVFIALATFIRAFDNSGNRFVSEAVTETEIDN
jgi:hypothetical protein